MSGNSSSGLWLSEASGYFWSVTWSCLCFAQHLQIEMHNVKIYLRVAYGLQIE